MSRATKMYMEISKVKGRQGVVTLKCKPVLKLLYICRADWIHQRFFLFSTTTITFLNLKNHPKLSQMDPL